MGARIYRQASTWAQRRGGHGYMGISLHSRAHTGAGLRHMLEWVNRESTFDRLRIGLSDTLNRFNYMGDEALTEEQARAKALSIGDQWLAENGPSLSCLTIPYEIIRWDHWQTTNPDVIAKNRRTYMNAFRANPAFREAMLQDMDNFMRRRYKKTPSETDFYATGPLVNYLIEELAVGCSVWAGAPLVVSVVVAARAATVPVKSSRLSRVMSVAPRSWGIARARPSWRRNARVARNPPRAPSQGCAHSSSLPSWVFAQAVRFPAGKY
jgi:tRNA-dependent cyclodipeptide synthase